MKPGLKILSQEYNELNYTPKKMNVQEHVNRY